jgi:hypothetical protein
MKQFDKLRALLGLDEIPAYLVVPRIQDVPGVFKDRTITGVIGFVDPTTGRGLGFGQSNWYVSVPPKLK